MTTHTERVVKGASQITHTERVVIGVDDVRFILVYHDLLKDQGLTIDVVSNMGGGEKELLRFYCFDHEPRYYYGPEGNGDLQMIDKTTEGDPLDWALSQIRHRLPSMVTRAGHRTFADSLDMKSMSPTLDKLESTAREMFKDNRSTVVHNRGEVIVEAGPIRIGLESRDLPGDGGIAIHVLGDIGDEEHELLTFDCFDNEPHYHYGPRAKNQRLYIDTDAIPDPLQWTLDLFKGGKLVPMLQRAGYYDHAARLNPATVAEKIVELEKEAVQMRDKRIASKAAASS